MFWFRNGNIVSERIILLDNSELLQLGVFQQNRLRSPLTIDANGILNVSAFDKSTGKQNKITITNHKVNN